MKSLYILWAKGLVLLYLINNVVYYYSIKCTVHNFIAIFPWVIRGKTKNMHFSCYVKGSMVNKTFVTQQVLNLGTHSSFRFFTRYSFLSGFLSFFILLFSVFSFSDSRSVFPLFTQTQAMFILAITLQALLSDTILPSHFPPFPLLCSALYMFSLAFFYLGIFSSSFLDKTLQILHGQ